MDNIAASTVGDDVKIEVGAPDSTSSSITLASNADEFGGIPHDKTLFGSKKNLGDWTVTFRESVNTSAASSVVSVSNGHHRLNPDDIRDLLIVFRYTVS